MEEPRRPKTYISSDHEPVGRSQAVHHDAGGDQPEHQNDGCQRPEEPYHDHEACPAIDVGLPKAGWGHKCAGRSGSILAELQFAVSSGSRAIHFDAPKSRSPLQRWMNGKLHVQRCETGATSHLHSIPYFIFISRFSRFTLARSAKTNLWETSVRQALPNAVRRTRQCQSALLGGPTGRCRLARGDSVLGSASSAPVRRRRTAQVSLPF